MSYLIRAAKEDEIKQVWDIEKEAYPDPWPLEAFYDELENDIAFLYIAETDGAIIGFYDMWVWLTVGHLLNIAVRKDRRRTGLGTALLGDAMARAVQNGATSLYLEVRENNHAAISLYKKAGFERRGFKRDYYGDGENAIIMAVRLA